MDTPTSPDSTEVVEIVSISDTSTEPTPRPGTPIWSKLLSPYPKHLVILHIILGPNPYLDQLDR